MHTESNLEAMDTRCRLIKYFTLRGRGAAVEPILICIFPELKITVHKVNSSSTAIIIHAM